MEMFNNISVGAWILIGVALILGFAIKSLTSAKRKDNSEQVNNLNNALDEANAKISKLERSAKNGNSSQVESLVVQLDEAKKELALLKNNCSKNGSSEIFNKQLEEAKKQVDANKKKIDNLEEVIEEKDDDIKDLKKKVSKKDEEKQQIENELYTAKKDLQNITVEKTELEKKNKLAEQEIKEMKDSNEFVSTLLNAPNVNSEDTKKIEKAIDELEIFIKSDLKSFYDNNFDVNDDYGKLLLGEKSCKTWPSIDTWVAQSKKTWLSNKKVISFIGEFSAGKTTIVNTILKQGDPSVPKLPTNSKATTAIPTYISGGKITKYTFVSPDDTRKNIAKEKFENVTKEALSKFEGINKLIKYFVMEYDNKNLQNLTILDTPGFQSNDPEDEQRTLGVVNESDALFWVVDVNRGELNAKSVKILANFKKPLYFILNQCDTVSSTAAESVKAKVMKTAKDAGLKFNDIILFGSNYPLSNIMNPINKATASNLNNYIEQLVSMVTNDESAYKNAVVESKKNLKEWDDHIETVTDALNDNIRILKQSAGNAAGVPHWETHIFSKDRYEMSSYEYNKLKSYLNDCIDCSDYVKQNFDGQMENIKNRTVTHECHMRNEQLNREFLGLSKQLKKLYNNLIAAKS